MVALFFVIKLKLQGVEALLLAQISVSSKKKKKNPQTILTWRYCIQISIISQSGLKTSCIMYLIMSDSLLPHGL